MPWAAGVPRPEETRRKIAATQKGRKFPNRQYAVRLCRRCGKRFQANGSRHWFCSKECRAAVLYEAKSVLTQVQYQEVFARQGGRCAICGATAPGGPKTHDRLYADHDHTTGRSRGLLCHNCNRGLGLFGDDAQRLLRAAAYVSGLGVRELLADAVERSCLTCGAAFRVKPSAIARGGGLYCSPACYSNSRRGRPNPRKGVPNPERWPLRETVCGRCGITFQHRKKGRKFCSQVCAAASNIRSTG